MKFGKFEINGLVIIWALFVAIIVSIIISSAKLDIEKERTKQMQITNVNYINERR